MKASCNGHLKVVRELVNNKADVHAEGKVRRYYKCVCCTVNRRL